jgi:hypothetical protein
MTQARIEVQGLREFQAALRKMDASLPKQLRVALNEASDLVVGYARSRMPSDTGRAKASLKARSSQREARVGMGGRKAPYAPWLDFGGKGKHGRPAPRPYIKEGRYVYAGLAANRAEVIDILQRAVTSLAHDAGVEVD